MDKNQRNHTSRSNIGEKPGQPASVSSETKAFPRYDDISHIDSAAVSSPDAPKDPTPYQEPDTTRYTELYCGSDSAIQ